MDTAYDLKEFEAAAAGIDKKLISEKGIIVQTGNWLDSVVLRISKKHWANDPLLAPQTGAAIFFSIWVHDKTPEVHKLQYNIHALRLRKLKGYKLTSREFATAFRKAFDPHKKHWPNVSADFGPLTLMEGWKKINPKSLSNDIMALANSFLKIDFLVDDLLEKYKHK